MASWFEQKIRRYEHMRWAQEPDRRVLPFAWGLEHVDADPNHPDPRAFFTQFSDNTVTNSSAWYAATPATDYALKDNTLTFTSQIISPWPENNRVHAQFFPVPKA